MHPEEHKQKYAKHRSHWKDFWLRCFYAIPRNRQSYSANLDSVSLFIKEAQKVLDILNFLHFNLYNRYCSNQQLSANWLWASCVFFDNHWKQSTAWILVEIKWVLCSLLNLAVDALSRSLIEFVIPETIEKIQDIVLVDRRSKMRVILNVRGFSYGSAFSILNDHLGLLTIENKCYRVTTSKDCFALFDLDEFFCRFITVGDSSKPIGDQEALEALSLYRLGRMPWSAHKVMTQVFWEAQKN